MAQDERRTRRRRPGRVGHGRVDRADAVVELQGDVVDLQVLLDVLEDLFDSHVVVE